MDKINWTDRVRNVKVLHRVKEDRDFYIQQSSIRLTELITSYKGPAF